MCLTCSHVFGGQKYEKIKCHKRSREGEIAYTLKALYVSTIKWQQHKNIMNEDECYLIIKP